MGMQRTRSRARAGTGPDSLAQNMLNPYEVMSVGNSAVKVRKKSGGVHGWWRGFDSKFMKPLFGGADPTLRRRNNAHGNSNSSIEHLRGGANVNIGSTGDFENSDGVINQIGENAVDEAKLGLVQQNSQNSEYDPPDNKETSEERSRHEHPEDIF
jgi:hypothetical protein